MATRLELHEKLEKLLDSKNVYYEPPENLKIDYPCFIYGLDDVYRRPADNIGYTIQNRYQITLIDRMPDNPVRDRLLELPGCSFDRSYKSDNLEHYVFTLYW